MSCRKLTALRRFAALVVLILVSQGALLSGSVQAQIPAPPTSVPLTRNATLSDFLVNRLRATTADQQDYVRQVVKLVEDGKLEKRLVLALERYASARNPYFPLPVYERALRFQGARLGVTVPTIQEIIARNGATAARALRDSRFQ